MNNLVKSILLFISGIIAGITGTHLLGGAGHEIMTHNKTPESPSSILAASDVTEAYYRKKLDSIAVTNEQLSRQSVATKTAIRKEQQNYGHLKKAADTLINRIASASDTTYRLQDCDSLAVTVSDMMAVTAQKDSLYDSLVNDLETQIASKDDGLQLQRHAYDALKLSLEQSTAQQDILHAENFLLKRNNHRQVVKSKVLYTGVIVLSGILTYGIISR